MTLKIRKNFQKFAHTSEAFLVLLIFSPAIFLWGEVCKTSQVRNRGCEKNCGTGGRVSCSEIKKIATILSPPLLPPTPPVTPLVKSTEIGK